MGDAELLLALSRLRPSTEADQLSRTVLTALKSVARRHHNLTTEIDELEGEMPVLLDQAAPALHRSKGIGSSPHYLRTATLGFGEPKVAVTRLTLWAVLGSNQ